MKYTIYKITNTVNGKIYIGKHQTKNLDDAYMGSGKMLQRALKKYGAVNFMKKILYVFDSEEEMNAKEADIVTEEFCLRDDTYNLCVGGGGGFSYINNNGLTRDKTEIGRIGGIVNITRHGSPWLRMDAAHKQATVAKRNKTFIEKYGSDGHKTFSGKTHTDQTKQLMSEKAKQRLKDPAKNSQFGTKWITDGKSNKKIKVTEVLPDGWKFGRI
jgi:hypothetical protein